MGTVYDAENECFMCLRRAGSREWSKRLLCRLMPHDATKDRFRICSWCFGSICAKKDCVTPIDMRCDLSYEWKLCERLVLRLKQYATCLDKFGVIYV